MAEFPSGIAIHQWKRDPEFRKLIRAPHGMTLIEADFAGQEFRWMAVESGDPIMLGLCQPGEDAHAFMGARCTGVTYDWLRENAETPDGKPKRQLGKVANLSLQYRTSPPTLVKVAAIQHNVELTLGEAHALRANYLASYREVPRYWKRQIAFAKAHGYVVTLAGRRVNLGDCSTWRWYDDEGVMQDWEWSHQSTAINFPIQGIGADQKYLGLMVLKDYLNSIGGRFYFELHDGLFFVVPNDKAEAAVHQIKAILSNLPYKQAWGLDLPIQFPVDAKIGPSWGELKKVH